MMLLRSCALALYLLWASMAHAAVSIDAVTVSGGTNDFGPNDSFAHTTAVDANVLLFCSSTVGAGNGDESLASVTYNATEGLTNLHAIEAGGNTRTEQWYRLAPTTGSHTVDVVMASDPWFINVAISLKQVLQTAPTHLQTATGASTTPNLSLTSAAGEFVIDCVTVSTAGFVLGDPTEGSGQTQQWFTEHDTAIAAFGSSLAGAATATPDWVISTSDNWAQAAVSLAPLALVGGARRQGVVPLP